ncbi:MAG: SDR family oxidoreductase [Acidobacteriota bacterium]|nr:SDR family oxidoreductase [Acidobacteriota bacterium]
MKLKPINQQVVVITGASSGIGRETALQFAARGAKVVAAARSESGLKSLIEEIRQNGGEAIYEICDVADFDQVQKVAEKAVVEYNRIDTWVNNAAVAVYATFEDTTLEEFRRILDVNLLGQVHGCKSALPHLRLTGGSLICISSVESKVAMPLHSAYAASKHAIAGFVDSLRRELIHEGVPVSVTNIMPASINTPFFSQSRTKMGVKPQGLPPFYQPSLVAEAILYAAENPVRDLIVGGAGKMMITSQLNSPALTDYTLSKIGFSWQQTNEPKSQNSPDNLFRAMEEENRVEGDFSDRAKNKSLYTWMQTRPVASALLLAGAIGGAALLFSRPSGNRANNEENYNQQADTTAQTGLPFDESGSIVAETTPTSAAASAA